MIYCCKMCGGSLEIQSGSSFMKCEYCGTVQTLPSAKNEQKLNLYNRANYFRRNGEYDKANGILETILQENGEDAETYWSIVLCRYGISYVEDPITKKQVATVNRVQYTPIHLDQDYQNAIKYADANQKRIFEEEAEYIAQIQKKYLEISSKEEPFDIFISYKETDEKGERTKDSVQAYSLYEKLTDKGYKVFLSRVTLEEKIGTAYEPYIFSAIHSSKVMLVLGTSQENFNSVWVRNEWSRFLSLMQNGEEKTLIPLFADMNVYDLPEELVYLQAQDMTKIGFEQDLLRGIEKILKPSQLKRAEEKSTVSSISNTMLDKAKVALLENDWDKSLKYYEMAIDFDENNVEAYIGKLLSNFKVCTIEDLQWLNTSIAENSEYKMICQLGRDEIVSCLKGYEKSIQENITKEAKKKKKRNIKIAVSVVGLIVIYIFAVNFMIPMLNYRKAQLLYESERYVEAIGRLRDNTEYKKNEQLLIECQRAFAMQLMEKGSYSSAVIVFEDIGDYSMVKECNYQMVLDLIEKNELEEAHLITGKIIGYKDVNELRDRIEYELEESK